MQVTWSDFRSTSKQHIFNIKKKLQRKNKTWHLNIIVLSNNPVYPLTRPAAVCVIEENPQTYWRPGSSLILNICDIHQHHLVAICSTGACSKDLNMQHYKTPAGATEQLNSKVFNLEIDTSRFRKSTQFLFVQKPWSVCTFETECVFLPFMYRIHMAFFL